MGDSYTFLLDSFKLSLSPSRHSEGEARLSQFAASPSSLLKIFEFVQRASCVQTEPFLVSASAIFAKNQILKVWSSPDLTDSERHLIRRILLDTIFESSITPPESLYSIIQFLSVEDYPTKWPSFLADIKSRIADNAPDAVLKCFKILDISFEHIRKAMKSNESISLVISVSDAFSDVFLRLVVEASKDLSLNSNASTRTLTLTHAFSFYRSLITFDIPQIFVDHSSYVFGSILSVLKCWNDRSAWVLEYSKQADELLGCVFETLNFYSSRFDEDLEMLPEITQLSLSIVVSNADKQLESLPAILRFLAMIVKKDSVAAGFKNSAVLLLEKVIVPHMATTRAEFDLINEEPMDYCRSDFNALNDDESLMSSVSILMKSLVSSFPEEFSKASADLIISLTKSGSEGNIERAVRLFTASAILDYDEQAGVLVFNRLIEVESLLSLFLSPEFIPSVGPTVRIAILRLLFVMRKQKNEASLRILPTMIMDTVPVVSFYAIGVLNSILSEDVQKVVEPEAVAIVIRQCLKIAYSEENEYALEFLAKMALGNVRQDLLFSNSCNEYFMRTFQNIVRQGANVIMTTWFFEFLGCFFRHLGTEKNMNCLETWQQALIGALQNAEHLIGSVLQLLSVIEEYYVELSPGTAAVVPFLVSQDFWGESSFHYGACRLLSSSFGKVDVRNILNSNGGRLLEISKILLSSKFSEHVGYYFLENYAPHTLDNSALDQISIIFTLLFARLTSSRTLKRILDTTRIFSLCVLSTKKADTLTMMIQRIESIQIGLFKMIIQSLFMTCSQSSSDYDRKLHTVALCLLMPSIATLIPDYMAFVPIIFSGLLFDGDKKVAARDIPGALICAPPEIFSVSLDMYLEPVQYFATCAAEWNSYNIINVRQLVDNMQPHQRDRIFKLLNF